MLGFKVSQATVSRYLATVHRSPGQSWRTFIRNEALAFRYRDDLEYSNQDWQSRPDCSYCGNLTRSARQIARLDTGSRWLSQPRGIAAPPRLCARSASLRTFRYSTTPRRSPTAGANLVSFSVRMRGPPRHTARFLKAGGSRKVCGPSFEKGQGILILILVVIRFVNRRFSTLPPFPATMSSQERIIAHASEMLLYTLLFVQPLVGWGMLSAARYPIVLYGPLHLFPILPHSVMLYAALRKAHAVLAYLLFLAFIAHFGAVLFHTLILRDRLFSRMAPYRVPAR